MNPQLSSRNKITKNAAFLYLRMILVMLISLVSVRILLKSLGVEDYGLYNAIGGVVASMTFITGTLTLSSQRFFSYELGKIDGNLTKVFNTIFIVYIGVAIVLFLLLSIGGCWFIEYKMIIPSGQLKIAKTVLILTVLTFITTVLTNPFPALIIAKEEMHLYAYLSITDVVMKLGAVLLLLLPLEKKIIVYSISIFIVSIIYILLNFFICHRRYKECRFALKYDLNLFKSISSFSGWTLFGSVAAMGYNQGLNVMLNVFIGPLANAAYAVANQVANAINSLGAGYFSAMRPSFIRSFAMNDKHYSRNIFNLSNIVSFLLLSVISIPLLLNTEIILKLWLGEIHEYMVSFTRLICCAILVQNLGMPLTTIAQGANIVRKYHLFVDGFTLVGLFILYILFKQGFTPQTVLIAYVIIFIIAHLIRILITKNTIELAFFSHLKSFLFPACCIYVSAFTLVWLSTMKISNALFTLLISILISTIYLTIMSYAILLTKDEKHNINLKLYGCYSKLFNKNRNDIW